MLVETKIKPKLTDDSSRTQIQFNTFTRWINEQLKPVNKQIDDLQSCFNDGLSLIYLIEILSNKKLPRINKKPLLRLHKLENISIALDFLENVERIKIINIGNIFCF